MGCERLSSPCVPIVVSSPHGRKAIPGGLSTTEKVVDSSFDSAGVESIQSSNNKLRRRR
ncbi:hypothetical protein U1Q18_021439 [Sarracenia purpurea var. burkii]